MQAPLIKMTRSRMQLEEHIRPESCVLYRIPPEFVCIGEILCAQVISIYCPNWRWKYKVLALATHEYFDLHQSSWEELPLPASCILILDQAEGTTVNNSELINKIV